MKSIIIIAAMLFCMASCNNPSSPARTMTDSTSVNSNMDTAPGNMNADTMNRGNMNADTMNNRGNMNNTDTMNNRRPADSLR